MPNTMRLRNAMPLSQQSIVLLLAAGTMVLWPYPSPILSLGFRPFVFVFILFCLGASLPIFRNASQLIAIKKFAPSILFVGVHWFSWFLMPNYAALSFTGSVSIYLAASIILVLAIKRLDDYALVIKVILYLSSISMAVLIYRHLVNFDVFYLAPHFSFSERRGYTDRNVLSFFLLLFFPFAYALFTHQRRLGHLLLLAIISFSAILTFSRMALVVVLFSILIFPFMGSMRKRYLVQLGTLLASGLILIGVFRVSPWDGYLKYLKWKRTTIMEQDRRSSLAALKWGFSLERGRGRYLLMAAQGFLEKPVLGHGLVSFGKNNPEFCAPEDLECQNFYGRSKPVRLPRTHNDYVQILFELGVVGFIPLLWLVLDILRRLWRSKERVPRQYQWLWDGQCGAVAALFLSLFFNNAYEAWPFWFIVAGCYIVAETSSKWGEAAVSAPTNER